MRCAIVAGSANNQLAHEEHGELLRQKGILFAPDYIINAGGLISVGLGLFGEDPNGAVVRDKVCRIGATLGEIFEMADTSQEPPDTVANRLAAKRIECRWQQGPQVA